MGENLICVSWLSSDFWLSMIHFFLPGFTIKLVLTHSLTHAHSIKHTHSSTHLIIHSFFW